MTDLGESVEPKSIASTFLGVEELRSKGHEQDNHNTIESGNESKG